MNNWIKLVGTAGARFVVARQLRSSGGIWLSLAGANLYLDPGPGALVRCFQSDPPLDPATLDGILLSHKHLDHSGDINAMIEAMTEGGYNHRGVLFAPEDALEDDPVVLRYVRDYLDRIEILKEHRTYTLGELKFSTAGRHRHSVETYGFNFHLAQTMLSFIPDTKFFPGLTEQYPGDILVVNVVLVSEIPNRSIDHLSLEDVWTIMGETRAQTVVMTHFGTRMLQLDLEEITRRMSAETGKKVIAAEDGMVLEINNEYSPPRPPGGRGRKGVIADLKTAKNGEWRMRNDEWSEW